jgi:hypothetical protein
MTIGEDNRVRYKNATDAIIKLIDLRFAPCVYALQKTVRSKTIKDPGKDLSYTLDVDISEDFNIPEDGITCSAIENNTMAMKYYINRLNRWLAEWTAEEKIGYSITQPFIITFTLK